MVDIKELGEAQPDWTDAKPACVHVVHLQPAAAVYAYMRIDHGHQRA
jgi:hypothetical protein